MGLTTLFYLLKKEKEWSCSSTAVVQCVIHTKNDEVWWGGGRGGGGKESQHTRREIQFLTTIAIPENKTTYHRNINWHKNDTNKLK